MSLISLVVVLAVVGVLLYVLNTLVPMAAPIKTLINVVVVLVACLWVLEAFGLISGPSFGGHVRLR